MLGVYRTDLRGPINAKHLLVEIPPVAMPVCNIGGAHTSTAAHARGNLKRVFAKLPVLQSVRTGSAWRAYVALHVDLCLVCQG
jgi:hypothetical protein